MNSLTTVRIFQQGQVMAFDHNEEQVALCQCVFSCIDNRQEAENYLLRIRACSDENTRFYKSMWDRYEEPLKNFNAFLKIANGFLK